MPLYIVILLLESWYHALLHSMPLVFLILLLFSNQFLVGFSDRKAPNFWPVLHQILSIFRHFTIINDYTYTFWYSFHQDNAKRISFIFPHDCTYQLIKKHNYCMSCTNECYIDTRMHIWTFIFCLIMLRNNSLI